MTTKGKDDHDTDKPATQPARRLPEGQTPDQLRGENEAENRQEALIDEAVEETFPASDPPSPKHIT